MANEERDDALLRAIALAGGPAALARFISEHYEPITAQAVCDWRRCPPLRVLQVERAAKREVTRHELRPDLYPAQEQAA
jgi:DNA-binding transcriptional regulator YdaS (Cro superfamily)